MSEFVTVICRLPNGIKLELHDTQSLREAVKAGKASAAVISSKKAVLNGMNKDPRFHKRDFNLLGMGGRTPVEKDFWDAWLEQNKGGELVTKHLVFAEMKENSAVSKLGDFAKESTGLEGLDAKKPIEGTTKLEK